MAPALIALTAFSVSTYAVMKSTTLLGLCFNILSNHSYPSSPLIASRWKFMSSIMTLGSKESMNSRIRSGVVVTLIASTYGFKSILSDKSTSSLSSTINIFPHFSVAMLLSICSVCFFGGAERFSKLVSNVKNSDHLFICKGNFLAAYPKGQNTRNWRGRI